MELPVAPIGRIIKNAGAERVSPGAKDILRKSLERQGEIVAADAVKIAKHSGRKTISVKDINLSIEKNSNCNINIHNYSQSQIQLVSSRNVSLSIRDSFNEFHNELNERNPENKAEIETKIEELKQELAQDQVNKNRVQEITGWFQRNAHWAIPMIPQIIMLVMTGLTPA